MITEKIDESVSLIPLNNKVRFFRSELKANIQYSPLVLTHLRTAHTYVRSLNGLLQDSDKFKVTTGKLWLNGLHELEGEPVFRPKDETKFMDITVQQILVQYLSLVETVLEPSNNLREFLLNDSKLIPTGEVIQTLEKLIPKITTLSTILGSSLTNSCFQAYKKSQTGKYHVS